MPIDTRSYQGGDEAQILSLWQKVLPMDPIAPETFYQKFLLDPNFDAEATRVATDGHRIVGFTQAMVRKVPLGGDLEPDLGWITALLVDPQYRRRDLGRTLLSQAEAYLKRQGRARVEFSSYAPNYVVPGVDEAAYPGANAFFARAGYHLLYSCVAMDRNLVPYSMPQSVTTLRARLEQEGVLFEPISPKYYVALLDFTQKEFYGDWTRALCEALTAQVPPSQLYLCRQADTILGFAMFGAYDRSFDRFGPFGVAANERGRGLGKVLLHLVLEEQKRQQCHSAWFLWTGEKSPAGHLYRAAGFEVSRRFDILGKVLR